jgi:hypothetical protein
VVEHFADGMGEAGDVGAGAIGVFYIVHGAIRPWF